MYVSLLFKIIIYLIKSGFIQQGQLPACVQALYYSWGITSENVYVNGTIFS